MPHSKRYDYALIHHEQREIINKNSLHTLRVFELFISVNMVIFMFMTPFLYEDDNRANVAIIFLLASIIFLAMSGITHLLFMRRISSHLLIYIYIWSYLIITVSMRIIGNTHILKQGIGIWFPLFVVLAPSLFFYD